MSKGVRRLRVVSGNANPALAADVCQYLGIEPLKADVGFFPDGENRIHIREGVRGDTVFVIQPTCPPVDRHLMELLILISVLREGSARRVVAVLPYYGLGRQERKSSSGVPIVASLEAALIKEAGATHVLLLDLHAGAIQGFFRPVPADHITARPVIIQALRQSDIQCLVAPDEGALKMVIGYAHRLGVPFSQAGKDRQNGEETSLIYLQGEDNVRGRRVAILDDMAATGGTARMVASRLLEVGALSVDLVVIHPVMAGNAIETITQLGPDDRPVFRHIWTTDSIPLAHRLTPEQKERFTILSLAKLIGQAVLEIHNDGSVRQLFEVDEYLTATGQAGNS